MKNKRVGILCFLCICVSMGLCGCSNNVDTLQVTPELYLNTVQTGTEIVTQVEETVTTTDVLDMVFEDIKEITTDVDKAENRLNQFYKRLNNSNIHMAVTQLVYKDETVYECKIDAQYYADCAYVTYKDENSDIGLIVEGRDSYLLDSISHIAYSVDTKEIRYADSTALLSMFSTQDGAYMGTISQVVNNVTLGCDIYYVDNVVYKMCYDTESDALIMVIRIDENNEYWNIFETLTTVDNMRIFEVPEGYTYIRYEDYLEVHNGVDDKFALFLR